MKAWNYIKFAMRLKEIERSVYSTSAKNRKENVAEHTWSMSAIYWILKDDLLSEFSKLNSEKVYDLIQMHDLVEINTGDISTWEHKDSDKEKIKNEIESLGKILNILDEEKGQEFKALFTELEEMQTIEAKIVKGIDRISPAIQRVVTGQGWRNEKLSESDLDSIQIKRLEFSKTLMNLYNLVKDEAKSKNIL